MSCRLKFSGEGKLFSAAMRLKQQPRLATVVDAIMVLFKEMTEW